MTQKRELWPGEEGIVVYPMQANGTPFAALIPISDTTISGVSKDTDYWAGDHPSTWPKDFNLKHETRPMPTTATEATSYTVGSLTLPGWYSRPLQEFVGAIGVHTWSTGRAWKAEVPNLRTHIDHYIYLVWNGADFEWFVTTEQTAQFIKVDTPNGFDFSETSLTVQGVKATDL
jgi:hypothetical protein